MEWHYQRILGGKYVAIYVVFHSLRVGHFVLSSDEFDLTRRQLEKVQFIKWVDKTQQALAV